MLCACTVDIDIVVVAAVDNGTVVVVVVVRGDRVGGWLALAPLHPATAMLVLLQRLRDTLHPRVRRRLALRDEKARLGSLLRKTRQHSHSRPALRSISQHNPPPKKKQTSEMLDHFASRITKPTQNHSIHPTPHTKPKKKTPLKGRKKKGKKNAQ